MADIIVTTPKSRMAEAAQKAEEIKAASGGYYYRDYRAPRIPNVNIGDRVYYVENGYVRGFCNVVKIDRTGYGRRRAITVYMDATTWKWIKPIPTPFSPRSWGYAITKERAFFILRKDVEVVGGWLDPKPKAPGEKK